jgi:hypothetical protein
MRDHSIERVLANLDGIIERAMAAPSRLGYFAALYRGVTAKVNTGLDQDRFEDAERMERLVEIFANRYLDGFNSGKAVTASWDFAFRQVSRWRPLALQHLLLGMNAHINLDLGIAAARACPGDALLALERDFNEINHILAEELDVVQQRLWQISRFLGLLSTLGGRHGDAVIHFSMDKARAAAWDVATELAYLEEDEQMRKVEGIDQKVAWFGRRIASPGLKLTLVALLVRLREQGDIKRNIATLLGK